MKTDVAGCMRKTKNAKAGHFRNTFLDALQKRQTSNFALMELLHVQKPRSFGNRQNLL